MARDKKEKPRRLFQDVNVKPYIQACTAVAIAFLAFYLYQGMQVQLQFLSPSDGDKLKEVFFGNSTTWAILCHSDLGKPLYQPFEAAARKLSRSADGLSFGVLDCSAKLPKGRTTIQRFGLNKKIEPIIFVKSPQSRKPRQLLPRYMSSADVLAQELVSVVTPQAVQVRDSKGLQEHCTSQDLCMLVLKGKSFAAKEEKVLASLMKRYGTAAKFAVIDSILHETSLEQRLPRFNPNVNRVIIFSQKDKPSQLKAKVYNGDFTEKGLAVLLDDAVAGQLRMKKVDGAIEVFKRSTGPKAPPRPASPTSTPDSQTEGSRAPSSSSATSAGSDEAPAAQALSKEEEARLQAQREAAIREAMDREAQDFISHVGEDEEGEEAQGEATAGSVEEDEDVVDLDEL